MSEKATTAQNPNGQPQRLPMIYHVPENVMKPLFQYLTTRPYHEVHQIVPALQRVPFTDPNQPKEEEKTGEDVVDGKTVATADEAVAKNED